jgi:hypothetical protein
MIIFEILAEGSRYIEFENPQFRHPEVHCIVHPK